MQKLIIKCECKDKDIPVFWQVVIILAIVAILVWMANSSYAHYPLN